MSNRMQRHAGVAEHAFTEVERYPAESVANYVAPFISDVVNEPGNAWVEQGPVVVWTGPDA